MKRPKTDNFNVKPLIWKQGVQKWGFPLKFPSPARHFPGQVRRLISSEITYVALVTVICHN